uniref:protocadherin-9-like n=1 Tax=Euleptes europaea TaxID=460621 RepID=UPI00254142A9|nr:protocadherin-9-like [Euleptes europaea]
MTGTCTRECTEFGHSDTCWMPGQSSPSRRPKNALKLSTFVPYQDRGSHEQVGNGSPRLSEERSAKMANLRLLPTYSAFSNSSHEPCKDSPLEEIPLTQTSDFQAATTPSSQTAKREIYL